MKTRLGKATVLFLVFVLAVTMSVPVFAAEFPPNGVLTVEGDRLKGRDIIALRMFDIDLTAANGEDLGLPGVIDPLDTVAYTLAGGTGTATPAYSDSPWMTFFRQPEIMAMIGAYAAALDSPVTVAVPADITPTLIQGYIMSLTAGTAVHSDIDTLAAAAQTWAVVNIAVLSTTDLYADETALTTWKAADDIAGLTENAEDPEENPTARGKAVFDALKTGYYLVFPQGAMQVGEGSVATRLTNAMLVHVPGSLVLKSEYPSLDKKVEMPLWDDPATTDVDESTGTGFFDNGAAQIGDELTFKLSAVANVTDDYKAYYLQFKDTLSAGLTYTGTKSVTVDGYPQVDGGLGTYIREDANYNPLLPLSNPKNISWTFDDLLKAKISASATLGATAASMDGSVLVEVTYTAVLNEAAVVYDEFNRNTASVEFATNFENTGRGTSTDTVDVYTYEITIDKRDDNNDPVGGAEFILSKAADYVHTYTGTSDLPYLDEDTQLDKIIPLASMDTLSSYDVFEDIFKVPEPTFTTGEYRALSMDRDKLLLVQLKAYLGDGNDPLRPVPTDSKGSLTIGGLEVGTYYLYETKTPPLSPDLAASTNPDDRYPPAGPFKLEISVPDVNGTRDFANPQFSLDGNLWADSSIITIHNTLDSILPETGGIGTVGLTILGVAVIAGGVIFTSRKNRKNKSN